MPVGFLIVKDLTNVSDLSKMGASDSSAFEKGVGNLQEERKCSSIHREPGSTGYVICRVQCKIKMQAPLIKIIKNLESVLAEHYLFSCVGYTHLRGLTQSQGQPGSLRCRGTCHYRSQPC